MAVFFTIFFFILFLNLVQIDISHNVFDLWSDVVSQAPKTCHKALNLFTMAIKIYKLKEKNTEKKMFHVD